MKLEEAAILKSSLFRFHKKMSERAEIEILEEKGQDEYLRDCYFEDM